MGDIAVREGTEVIVSASDKLLEKVLDGGNIEVLERFIALREKEEARQARLAFDLHFAEMQKEFPAVKRTKSAKKDGKTLYKFCPIEDILIVCAPIISAHGFSYRWTEEAIQGTTEKRVFCIASGWGHEERGYVDIPIQVSTSFTNSIQQRGVSTSYGKRYSFINAFGVIIEDEDDDAMSFEDGVQYGDLVKRIRDCNTAPDLVETWKKIWQELGNDTAGKEKLSAIYNTCKEKFRVKNGTEN
jgi:hypothetical protein